MPDDPSNEELIALVRQLVKRQVPREEAEDKQIHDLNISDGSGIRVSWPIIGSAIGALVAVVVAATSFYVNLNSQLSEFASKLDVATKKLEVAAMKDDLKSAYISKDWMREYLEYTKSNNPTEKVPTVEQVTKLVP